MTDDSVNERATRIDMWPGSMYEVITRTMVNELAGDVKEIRDRINGLFWLIAGTVAIDLVLRIAGIGA